MSDELEALRAHWNSFAPFFAERIEATTARLARALLAHLALKDASSVLEVAAGAGGVARFILEDLPPAARLVVTDLSQKMLEMARSRLPTSVELREADAGNLPFPDASFDRALTNMALMLMPDPDQALAEISRVLRPGGLAAWSVWGRAELSPMFTIPPRAAETVGVEPPPAKRTNFHLGDRDALRARIARAGFEPPLAWYTTLTLPFPDGAAYAEHVLATARWKDHLAEQPADSVEALRGELARLGDESLALGHPLSLDALLVVARKPV